MAGDLEGWTERGPGYLQRPLVQAQGSVLSLLRLDPGTRFPAHRHPEVQLGMVLEGSGRSVVDGRTHPFQAGESYFVPSGSVHSVDTDVGVHTVALDLVVSPVRGRPMGERALSRDLWMGLATLPRFSSELGTSLVPPPRAERVTAAPPGGPFPRRRSRVRSST